jgi:hypothetical protein
MNAIARNSDGTRRTRTQVAETIATSAIVFVRRARRNGCTNKVTRDLIHDTATELGIGGDEYSVRTVETIIRRDAARMGETHLLEI